MVVPINPSCPGSKADEVPYALLPRGSWAALRPANGLTDRGVEVANTRTLVFPSSFAQVSCEYSPASSTLIGCFTFALPTHHTPRNGRQFPPPHRQANRMGALHPGNA